MNKTLGHKKRSYLESLKKKAAMKINIKVKKASIYLTLLLILEASQ